MQIQFSLWYVKNIKRICSSHKRLFKKLVRLFLQVPEKPGVKATACERVTWVAKVLPLAYSGHYPRPFFAFVKLIEGKLFEYKCANLGCGMSKILNGYVNLNGG